MSVARTTGRLLRWYPESWRSRYGQELEALILDMSGGGRVPWRVRADVISAGGRERLREVGHGRRGTPDARARSGAVLVLWAWALFVLGGAIVQKTSEHWQEAMPGGASTAPEAAFACLTIVAAAASVLVLAGIAWVLPSVLTFLRAGGWPHIRRRVRTAALATALALLGTGALIVLANGTADEQKAGHETAYAVAFLGWAALGAACLLTWTAVAAATARRLVLAPATLRAESWLATAVSVGMVVMTLATTVWWATVAHVAPGALTGGSDGAHASVIVPGLLVAAALMVLATALGAEGARRASRARRAMSGR